MKNVPLGDNASAIVDDEDYDDISFHSWRLSNSGYALSTENSRAILMHRIIMNPAKGLEIDHINGNKLDNRKSNLRCCTKSENASNSIARKNRKNDGSTFKGVSVYKYRKRSGGMYKIFRARIYDRTIGTFKNEVDAAVAYDLWAKYSNPEFVRLNFNN